MVTSLKTDFAQIFSRCPKNLSCPKFGGAAAPLAPPARTPMVTCFQFEKTMVRKVKLRGVLLCRNHWPRIAESSKFKLEHIQGSIPHQEKSNFKVPVRSGKLLSVTSDDMCGNF